MIVAKSSKMLRKNLENYTVLTEIIAIKWVNTREALQIFMPPWILLAIRDTSISQGKWLEDYT
jgi:hypothetical protein